MRQAHSWIALAAVVFALSGCGGGGDSSTPATPSLAVTAPTITTPPSSTSLVVGESATLTVVAAGSAPLAYQWQRDGVALSGATSSSYTSPPLALSDSGATFTVRVSNGAGSITSGAAVVTVTSPVAPKASLQSLALARLQVDLDQVFASVGLAAANSYLVVSQSGTAVSQSVAGKFLNVVGPVDVGQDQQTTFMLSGGASQVQLQIDFATGRPGVTIDDAGDADSDGSARIAATGQVKATGTVGAAHDLLADPALLGFQVTAPVRPKSVNVHLSTPTSGLNVTSMFSYDATTGAIAVRSDRVAALTTAIGSATGITFAVTGGDLDTEVALIYAPGKLRGTVVNASGVVQTTLAGQKLVLEAGLSRFQEQAVIAADGSFAFPAVPVESFNLELREAGNDVIAQASPTIQSVGQELVVKLVATSNAVLAAEKAGLQSAGAAPAAVPTPQTQLIEVSRTGPASPVFRRDATSRASLQAATPTTCEPTPGTFRVTGGAENNSIGCNGTYVIAKGTKQVKVSVTVSTDEFPGYSPTPGNPFNDRWSYNVQVGGKGMVFTAAGRVNDTHATKGSIKLVDQCVDVSAQTATATITAVAALQTTNIGDGILPTTVVATFGDCAGLQLATFRLERSTPDGGGGKLFLNTKAGAAEIRYFLSLPSSEGGYATLTFPASITYTPKDAVITGLKLQIQSSSGSTDLTPNALVAPNAFTSMPGTIKLTSLRIPSGFPSVKDGIVTLQATLTGTLAGVATTSDPTGATVAGDSKPLTNFLPLFDASQRSGLATTRRFSTRDTALGLDGWATKPTLDVLAGVDWIFNDISAQHTNRTAGGRSTLGHAGHGNGREVDVRYWNAAGVQADGPLNGNASGGVNPIISLVLDVCASTRRNPDKSLKTTAADNPQYATLVSWINANRSKLGAVMARADVLRVHVPPEDDKVSGALEPNPIHYALKRGQCTDGVAIGVGAWAPTTDKLSPAPPHNDHWHVTFKP